jgi:hypothetical protein
VLDQLLERAVGFTGFQFLQALHRLLDGAEVGQRAAEPALGHVRLAATGGFFLDRFARRALGAHEQDGAALLRDRRDEVHRVGEERHRLLEVDDVDLAAGAEDVRTHLGVPVTGLVAEVHAGLQHLAHGDLGHCLELLKWNRPPVVVAGKWFRGWASLLLPLPNLLRGTPERAVAAGVDSTVTPVVGGSWGERSPAKRRNCSRTNGLRQTHALGR